jgi:hypothetical protein
VGEERRSAAKAGGIFAGLIAELKQLAEKSAWTQLRLCPFQNGAGKYFGVNPD